MNRSTGRKAELRMTIFFRGAIDDIRLSNRAVNADEAQALFLENGFDRYGRGRNGRDRRRIRRLPARARSVGQRWTFMREKR